MPCTCLDYEMPIPLVHLMGIWAKGSGSVRGWLGWGPLARQGPPAPKYRVKHGATYRSQFSSFREWTPRGFLMDSWSQVPTLKVSTQVSHKCATPSANYFVFSSSSRAHSQSSKQLSRGCFELGWSFHRSGFTWDNMESSQGSTSMVSCSSVQIPITHHPISSSLFHLQKKSRHLWCISEFSIFFPPLIGFVCAKNNAIVEICDDPAAFFFSTTILVSWEIIFQIAMNDHWNWGTLQDIWLIHSNAHESQCSLGAETPSIHFLKGFCTICVYSWQ